MLAFRILLALVFSVLASYTLMVGASHGWDLAPVFFGDIAKVAWPGQFNLDFLCMLVLAATWVAYRHRFRAPGLALALGALVGGGTFLSAYLLIASIRARGDVATLLLGEKS